MLLKILLLFGFVALPFGGCGQQSAEELFAAGEAAAADPASLDQAVGHFKDFLEKFDQDPKASEALNKLAALAQQQGQMQEAIAYYERVLADYPESGHGDEAQFMIAFIYEEYVRDVERAGLRPNHDQSDHEKEVAEASDDERLLRGGRCRGLVEPEADQQVRGEADQLPVNEELQHTGAHDEAEHCDGEERHEHEVARVAAIPVHVAE